MVVTLQTYHAPKKWTFHFITMSFALIIAVYFFTTIPSKMHLDEEQKIVAMSEIPMASFFACGQSTCTVLT